MLTLSHCLVPIPLGYPIQRWRRRCVGSFLCQPILTSRLMQPGRKNQRSCKAIGVREFLCHGQGVVLGHAGEVSLHRQAQLTRPSRAQARSTSGARWDTALRCAERSIACYPQPVTERLILGVRIKVGDRTEIGNHVFAIGIHLYGKHRVVESLPVPVQLQEGVLQAHLSKLSSTVRPHSARLRVRRERCRAIRSALRRCVVPAGAKA